MNHDSQRMVTVTQLAERCEVSERMVRRWISAGELPVYRLGRQLRIRLQDFEIFLRLRRED